MDFCFMHSTQCLTYLQHVLMQPPRAYSRLQCDVSPSHNFPELSEQSCILLARIPMRTDLMLFVCTAAKMITQISVFVRCSGD
jgi:hypothetical protein